MLTNERIALIGYRKPPDNVVSLSRKIGIKLSDNDCDGFSGGANGMDEIFMSGFKKGQSFIIVPERKSTTPEHHIVWDELDNQTKLKSYYQAKSVCPDIDHRPIYHQKLFSRNALQVLGIDCMSPVDRVIFWAKERNGVVSGGTRIAVRIARNYGIPCHNLQNSDELEYFTEFVGGNSKTTIMDFM